MRWHVPPLKAVRAFEAAGRHQSFTAAAAELHVTAGAISRQIKILEDYLGIPLFERGYREVVLTPESRVYLALLTDIFGRLEAGTGRLLGSTRDRPLNIVCPMTLTTRWLVPRLPSFHKLHPTQQVRITTTLTLLQDGQSGREAGVTFQLGRKTGEGWVVHPLVQSCLVPLCSPKLIAPATRFESASELLNYTLLYSLGHPTAWPAWNAAMPHLDLSAAKTMEFASSTLTYQAAIEGIGIAMGEMALIGEDLAAGRLIMPLDNIVETGRYYSLVYLAEAEKDKRVQVFRDWIIEEARTTRSDGRSL